MKVNMRKLIGLRIGAAPIALGVAMLATPAFAQDGAGAEDVAETAADNEETAIIVTGSRIARPNLDAVSPVTSVTVGELVDSGDISLGDALNELPALRSTFNQSNSNRFIGTSGLSLLDLRGLGTNRTLVLINGRRQVGAIPGDFRIDVNTIPTELLERVDIVTGGNSAVYGSEAVAGVVNFITKSDFEGLRVTGQASITDRGDREQQFFAVTAGKNFADGRGNIAFSAEYANADALFNRERDSQTGAFSGRPQFNRTTFGSGRNSFTFFDGGIRNGNISDGTNILGISCNTSTAALEAATCATDRLGDVVNQFGV